MKYTLNVDCFLVESKRGRAIYNINGHMILALSQEQYTFLKNITDNNKINQNKTSNMDLWTIGELYEKAPVNNERSYGKNKLKFIKSFKKRTVAVKELFIRLGDEHAVNCYFCSDELINYKRRPNHFSEKKKDSHNCQKLIENMTPIKDKSLHLMDSDSMKQPKDILDNFLQRKDIKSIFIYTDEHKKCL